MPRLRCGICRLDARRSLRRLAARQRRCVKRAPPSGARSRRGSCRRAPRRWRGRSPGRGPTPGVALSFAPRSNFSKMRLLAARRQARARGRRPDHDTVSPAAPALDLDRRARRRVLGGVLQQVAQHPLDQHGVERAAAAGRRQRHVRPGARRARARRRAQRAADHFFQRLPLPVQLHLRPPPAAPCRAGCSPARSCAAPARGSRAAISRCCRPVGGGSVSASESASPTSAASGVRRSCEMADSSELRSRSDSICTVRASAPRRRSGCAPARCASSEAQVSSRRRCSGPSSRAGVARLDRQHAAHAHRRLQRQVEAWRWPAACRCRGRRPRRGRRPIARCRGRRRRQRRRRAAALQPVVARRPPAARPARRTRDCRKRAPISATCSGISAPTGRATSRRAPRTRCFALRARPGLVLQPGGQLPDHQRHHQHHGEGQQVLHVADGEGEARRHEEEVEQRHAEERGQHRRPAAVAHAPRRPPRAGTA